MKLHSNSFFTLGVLLALPLLPLAVQAQTPVDPASLTSSMKTEAVDTLLKDLQQNYVFPEKAKEVAEAIHAHMQAHDYEPISNGEEFARLLTEHLQAVCKDAHLRVFYSPTPLPVRAHSDRPSPEEERQWRALTKRKNAGVEKVEILTGNVGYLDLWGFMDPQSAARPIRAAMDFLANTDALILDLRRNGGGDPETVRLFCTYLFDREPVHLNDIYFRQGNHTTQYWTLHSVQGHRYLSRAVYVLTSKRTASGAEECSYDLQNLKRATILGESTWGGANPGDRFRLTEHFSAFIPEGRAINPYTHTNWEGTGVTPDVRIPAAQALQSAHLQALKQLLENASPPEEKEFRLQALREAEAQYKTEAGQKAVAVK